jgi:ABC-type Fe3+ transport system permease subunit
MSFPDSTAYPEASQATTALVLGILGIICCPILGIVAWIMGNNELEGIRSGRRSPASEGTANASRILGIIGTVLLGIWLLLALLGIAGLFVIPFTGEFG